MGPLIVDIWIKCTIFFAAFFKGVKFGFVLGLEIVKSQTVTTVSAVMTLAEED